MELNPYESSSHSMTVLPLRTFAWHNKGVTMYKIDIFVQFCIGPFQLMFFHTCLATLCTVTRNFLSIPAPTQNLFTLFTFPIYSDASLHKVVIAVAY